MLIKLFQQQQQQQHEKVTEKMDDKKIKLSGLTYFVAK